MERSTKTGLYQFLNAKVAIPDDAFIEGIDKTDQCKSCSQLRIEFGTFGDATGNNRWNRRSESQ